MEIKHAEREHAKYSPSSLENREACPGWENREGDETVWASDGEKCHEALSGLVKGDETLYKALAPDLQIFTRESFDYMEPRYAGCELLVSEQRLYHKDPILKQYAHGTPDLYAITGPSCQLFDAKFGRRPVTKAETNLQGWAYALALFDTYEQIETITIHFVVPRVHECTSHFTFTRTADYDRLLARVLRSVERADLDSESKRKLLKPSWNACAYCAAKAKCEALTRFVENVYDLVETQEFQEGGLTEALQSELPEAYKFRYEAAKIITEWATQTMDDVKQKAIEGNEVAGYELRFTKGRTTVKTVDKVLAAGVEIPLDKILSVATIPLADLKEIYVSSDEAADKKSKERELMTKLATGQALKSGESSSYLFRLNEKQ